MNHKRLHRIYREAGLMIRRKKRKHCVREGKPLVARTAANQEWALDFVHDAVEYMTIYEWPSGSRVVATGSMQWNWGLDESFALRGRTFTNASARAATRNILNRFGALPNRSGQVASAP